MPSPRSLVTGATGYVGGRLVPQLLEAGHTVRVLVRDERKARAHPWSDDVEIAVGDASDGADVRAAMQDVDVLYYLLHSIGTGGDFGATEKLMAQRFADEARRAGVRRIVYLGGMIPDDEELSEHLSSRGEVGDVLLASGVPTSWSSAATAGAPAEGLPTDPDWAGGSLYRDERVREVAATPEQLWSVIEGIGGRNGWYSWPLGWWVRGLAWLEMQVGTTDTGSTTFRHRALFAPKGLLGHAYWWSVYPFHGIVFGSMQRNIARAAEDAQH
jgi:hypothetical protein